MSNCSLYHARHYLLSQQSKVLIESGNREDPGVTDLMEVLQISLERKGSLDELRAKLRYEIFQCIKQSIQHVEEGNRTKSTTPIPRPPMPPKENDAINDMIIEYFRFNGYEHSLNIFEAEIGKNLDPSAADVCSKEHQQMGTPSLYSLLLKKDTEHRN